jgi:phosphate transport system substrate-binding protein
MVMKNDLNDEFLQGLRAEPSKKFLSTLKANLDRQASNQAGARRALFRTAILAALIGGSAVAVAFVVLRGSPGGRTIAPIIAAEPQPSTASMVGSERNGGGAPNTIDSPAQGSGLPPTSQIEAAPAAPPVQKQSRGTIVVAGPTAIILNGQEILRRWTQAGSKIPMEFSLTSTFDALAMFCHAYRGEATGASTADIAGANRRILPLELEHCKSNGVTHVLEIQSGYEAVVLVRSKLYGPLKLSARDIFLALAAEVPDPNRPQSLIKNPYRTWNAVDGALLEEKIEVLGPALSSATVAAFRQTLMEAGCATFPWLAALKQSDTQRYEKICRTLRDDGAYRDKAERLREHLETYPNTIALLDFREFAAWPDPFAVASIDGVEPGIDSIVAGTYTGSRAMFMYVNNERARGNSAVNAFVDAYRRSLADFSSSITTLVAPLRQADARTNFATPQELKF